MTLRLALLLLAFLVGGTSHAGETRPLTVTGPPGGLLSLPVYRMMETGALEDEGYTIEFTPWKNPDQLRAIVLSGRADFAGMPTNVAANLHNRSVDVRLVNVSVWKTLWVVSSDPEVDSLEDLRGEELVVPFKGDLPELIFNECIRDRDLGLKIRTVASSIDASQLLLAGRIEHAVVAEPKISAVLAQARTRENAPALRRAVDLQAEWGRLHGTEARIALAGMAALGTMIVGDEAIEAFHAEYAAALAWCRNNPEQAGELANRHFPAFAPEAIAESLGATVAEAIPSGEARGEIESFFRVLAEDDSAKIGGELPGPEFYWTPERSGHEPPATQPVTATPPATD